MASQTTSVAVVYSIVYSGPDESIKAPRHWPMCGNSPGPVNSPHEGPVTRKMFPFDDVIMNPEKSRLIFWHILPFVKHKWNSTVMANISFNRPANGGWHTFLKWFRTLQWRYYEHNGVPNHRRHGCLLNSLFRCRSKKTSKLRVTGLCAGNSPVTGEFPTKRANNVEDVSIW